MQHPNYATMDLISAAAEQNRDEALARAMHDTKSMQACRTKVNLPSAEKCEVDINRARSDMSLSDVMTDSVRAAAPAQISTRRVALRVRIFLLPLATLTACAPSISPRWGATSSTSEKGGGGCCEIL